MKISIFRRDDHKNITTIHSSLFEDDDVFISSLFEDDDDDDDVFIVLNFYNSIVEWLKEKNVKAEVVMEQDKINLVSLSSIPKELFKEIQMKLKHVLDEALSDPNKHEKYNPFY